MRNTSTPEHQRLSEDARRDSNWKRWGPYVSERQWGTVREDYSPSGDAWGYFPHDHARMRAYRWGEDGLLGICDRECRLCFSVALWNERDPILKERLFGLTNPEGNHGEDAKEAWFYLDSTPTHSWMRGLYKYPQSEYPYSRLIEGNRNRSRQDREMELHDTGIFDQRRYFDVLVEYAKATADDIYIRITLSNRGPEPATIHVLPTVWFRNTWSWGRNYAAPKEKPNISLRDSASVIATHETLGTHIFETEGAVQWLFTENETNNEKLYGTPNVNGVAKDGFHDYVIHGRADAVRFNAGTKCAPHFVVEVGARSESIIRLRLRKADQPDEWREAFDDMMATRQHEADTFYATKIAPALSLDQKRVNRQAFAGLLWTKQYYGYVVEEWVKGDPGTPPPPKGHSTSRNHDWEHFHANDVLSMPDKWEYPWFAAWDLAFHMIPMARVDPEFAKEQLLLLLREWYMHPNGQIPAYEWNFRDVNPPVHAWACWRVYKIAGREGHRDRGFLERCFQKLLLNFTWWVNRKDVQGRHIFAGGFLGLDNIGLFDRSQPLPNGHQLAQADGTAWMAFYCGTMLSIATELAKANSAYEDIASKFFEHFVQIVDATNALGGSGLWDETDGFYYDQILLEDGSSFPLRVRSMVGIIPLLAVEVLDQDTVVSLPGFRKRMRWFVDNRPDLAQHVSYMERCEGANKRELRLLAIPSRERLARVLKYVLDEAEFLSPFGIRSLSRVYHDQPYTLQLGDTEYTLRYEPAESQSSLFGGNSNWRGPIWFPINYLLIEALERYHHYYGDSFKIQCPTGTGPMLNLAQVAHEIARRMASIFTVNEKGKRPCFGDNFRFSEDPHWRDCLLFHEYFHGEIGCGLGANHQTGWTALITRILGIVGRVSAD